MDIRTVRNVVACIVVGGHFLIFFSAVLLFVIGPLRGLELTQVLLMASPVLTVTATSAARSIIEDERNSARRKETSLIFALFVIIIPSSLILAILSAFWACYREVPGFGPIQLNIFLGAIEVVFGAYIGMISDKLFSPVALRR